MVAWGLLPLYLCWFCAGAYTGGRVTALARVGQFLPKWPSLPHSCCISLSLQVGGKHSSCVVALNPVLLGRRLPRPLGLEMGLSVGLPPLLVLVPGPRWSSHSLLGWVLSLHLYLHLLHDLRLLHQGGKILDG